MAFKDFKEWLKLQEVGTGTNSIAAFARPLGIGTIEREKIPTDKDKKKK